MSYWLEDADEKWLGDFATNKGIIELREGAGESLLTFLHEGEADVELVELVIEETADRTETKYIAKMLRDVKAPVFITDGSGHENQEEE